MFENVFRSHKQNRPQRPSFRPTLETLESREVPSCAQVSAAFNQLPAAVNNLQASLAAQDVNGINANLSTVASNMFLLRAGASGFTTSNRLQIDNALITDGIRLLVGAFRELPFIPTTQVVNVAQTGIAAIDAGAFDALLTGFFPATSGDCVLT